MLKGIRTAIVCAPVAQLDRVFGYEPKGRGFESLRACQVGAGYIMLAPIFSILYLIVLTLSLLNISIFNSSFEKPSDDSFNL